MSAEAQELHKRARVTGMIYLLYFLAGMPLFLRSSLIVPTDAAATAAKITASENLYRTTIVTDLISYCLYLGLSYLFYLLLKHVSRPWAVIGTLFTVAGCIVLITATAALTIPPVLLTGNQFRGIPIVERQAFALLAIRFYSQAYVIGLLLFGVQWLIMGPLFAKSRVVPKAIGYLLTLGGIGWVSFATVTLAAPPFAVLMRQPVLVVGSLAELALFLWLLICGAKPIGRQEIA